MCACGSPPLKARRALFADLALAFFVRSCCTRIYLSDLFQPVRLQGYHDMRLPYVMHVPMAWYGSLPREEADDVPMACYGSLTREEDGRLPQQRCRKHRKNVAGWRSRKGEQAQIKGR